MTGLPRQKAGSRRAGLPAALLCVAAAACSPSTGGSTATAPDATSVVTTEGTLVGVREPGVAKFLGIPYARPPVGHWRWRAPAPPSAYRGTYDASYPRAECLQNAGRRGDEDCLYLNVYRPTPSTGPVTDAPVLFWIHGGGYSTGSGSRSNFAPFAISQNVVVVSINYRLGALGFLAHPALSAEEDPPRSGNYAILDMQMALAWVRRNIAAFGGDPANVTIMGLSAGGNAVYTLLASPTAAGLFHTAIPQSGGNSRDQPPLAEAEARGLELANMHYGCVDTDLDPGAQPVVAHCLQNISADVIMSAPPLVDPIIDGMVLVETTADAFRHGRFNQVPVIGGSTHDEGTIYAPAATDADYAELAERQTGAAASAVADRYPVEAYPTPSQALATAVGDHLFYCGAIEDVGQMSNYVEQAYFYDWNDADPAPPSPAVHGFPVTQPPIEPQAAHGLDPIYWFGLILPRDLTPEREELSNTMMAYVGNFMRTGNPNQPDLPTWHEYDVEQKRVMHLTYPIDGEYDGYGAHHCDFWNDWPPARFLR